MSREIAAECVAFERTPHSFFFAHLSLFRYFWSRTKTLKKTTSIYKRQLLMDSNYVVLQNRYYQIMHCRERK